MGKLAVTTFQDIEKTFEKMESHYLYKGVEDPPNTRLRVTEEGTFQVKDSSNIFGRFFRWLGCCVSSQAVEEVQQTKTAFLEAIRKQFGMRAYLVVEEKMEKLLSQNNPLSLKRAYVLVQLAHDCRDRRLPNGKIVPADDLYYASTLRRGSDGKWHETRGKRVMFDESKAYFRACLREAIAIKCDFPQGSLGNPDVGEYLDQAAKFVYQAVFSCKSPNVKDEKGEESYLSPEAPENSQDMIPYCKTALKNKAIDYFLKHNPPPFSLRKGEYTSVDSNFRELASFTSF